MASVRFDFPLAAGADFVWAAVRDFGAVHTRLAPGFLADGRLEGDVRILTFFNGLVARETLVARDDAARRLVYAILGGERLTHYNASVEILPEGRGCRFVWTIDLLPDSMAEPVRAMAAKAVEAMTRTLEADASAG